MLRARFAHGLHALGVGRGLAGREAEDVVPICRGDDVHLGDGEVFIQHVEARNRAGAAGAGDGGGELVREAALGGVEKPVEEAYERAVGRGVVDRRADNQRVGGLKLRRELVDPRRQ